MILETPAGNLGRAMHLINSSYTTYVNIKRKRSGHLFQGRYKSIVVDRDSYLLELSRYLHLKPVRARMVERPGQYRYSSYPAYVGAGSDSHVSTSVMLGLLGNTEKTAQAGYQAFVESAIGASLESPLKKVYGGTILGTEGFIEAVLGKISVKQRDSAETSHRQALNAVMQPGGAIAAVRRHYGIAEDVVLSGEPRAVCLYLLKRHSSAKNGDIGVMLGGMGAAAVAKSYQRITRRLEQDRDMAKAIATIEWEVSRVKG